MLTIGNKEVGQLWLGSKAISAVYIGAKLVWEAISNCIAGGWWQHGHGWQYGIGWGQKHK